MATGAVKNKYTFHNLQPGVKYRVRIRAIDGEGNKGDYSNPVDIIAGIGSSSRPSDAVSGLTVSDYDKGVEVSWNVKSNARGYEVYTTEGDGSQPDPDPTNKAHLYYRGNATRILVKADSLKVVKVRVYYYNEFGWTSSGYASGQAAAK